MSLFHSDAFAAEASGAHAFGAYALSVYTVGPCAAALLVCFVLAGGQVAFGQQAVCPGLEGEAAIDCIQENYSPNQTLGYDRARDTLYARIDADSTGELEGIYSGYTIVLTEGEDPSKDAFSKDVNAEHVFPQSKGAGTEPRKSDMHNLRPAREQVNSARSNIPFGESPDAQTDTWYYRDQTQESVPSSNIDEYSERLGQVAFEPRERKEGDLARSALYFYAVYRSAADSAFFEGMREQLLDWHVSDPATEAERTRSRAIAQRQGNENPFVLDSTLAQRAFSGGGGGEEPPTAGAGRLYISEVSDAENDFTAEFLEIYNDSTGAVDLATAGVKIVQDFQNGSQVFVFDFGTDETGACKSTTVPGKAAMVLTRGATKETFEDEWGPLPEGTTYCAFSQNSFFPGTNERAWEIRAGGTPNEPGDGRLIDSSPQFDGIEGARAYQDLARPNPWVTGEPAGSATPGKLDSGQTLPVELLAFEARVEEGRVSLRWEVTETRNEGFRVERRRPGGEEWIREGFIQSKAPGGTSAEPTTYRYITGDLSHGKHSFRLREVGPGGSVETVGQLSARMEMKAALRLGTAPNPARGQATVSFAVRDREKTTLVLRDVLGRRVKTLYRGAPAPGEHHRIALGVESLPSGTYFLRLRAGEKVQTRRVTVLH